jgi:hypothetical protein
MSAEAKKRSYSIKYPERMMEAIRQQYTPHRKAWKEKSTGRLTTDEEVFATVLVAATLPVTK